MSMIDHHHHTGTSNTTVVDDRSGVGVAIAVIVALAVIGLLVWLFAYSGVVFDRDDGTNTRIEQRIQETDQGGSQTNVGGTSSPAPAPS